MLVPKGVEPSDAAVFIPAFAGLSPDPCLLQQLVRPGDLRMVGVFHWSNSTGTGCELQAFCCAQVSETATQSVLNGLQLKLKVHKPLAAESCYSSVLEVPSSMNAHRAVVCLHVDIALHTDSPRLRSTFSMSFSVSP